LCSWCWGFFPVLEALQGSSEFACSVVIIDEDGHMLCQKGYRSLEEMKQLLGENDA
jgi:protein-disulfide isomerase-like protein with CxxC motif